MTNENNKSECIDAIVRMLERTSAWRRSIAPNFNDPRNGRACEILDKLAVDAAGMSESQFQSLEKYFAWDSLQWRNGLSLASRQIGFHNRSSDFRSFVIMGHAVGDDMSRHYTNVPQPKLIEAINTLPVVNEWANAPWMKDPLTWANKLAAGTGKRNDLLKKAGVCS